MVVKAADYAGFEARQQAAAKRGILRGIGVATYIEACAMAPSVMAGQLGARAGFYESAEVRVHPTGSITVFTGSHSHGQGHETTFAQLVANRLGLAIDKVDVVHGDTSRIPFGMGTATVISESDRRRIRVSILWNEIAPAQLDWIDLHLTRRAIATVSGAIWAARPFGLIFGCCAAITILYAECVRYEWECI